ncbi:MAG: exodeoxyribonuclease VII large subunit [Oscillospiraceae bacterium]
MCEVAIYPAQVQGEAAKEQLVRALKKADASGADVLILARGGGSAEDLMAFNAEAVALAVADCVTPVISAVGHETDTTLADYAADLRAPTPSAAAELAVPELKTLSGAVAQLEAALDRQMENKLAALDRAVEAACQRLQLLSPAQRLKSDGEKLASLFAALDRAMSNRLVSLDAALGKHFAILHSLSPFAVLSRGYVIATEEQSGRVVRGATQVSIGDTVRLRFEKSEALACVTTLFPEAEEEKTEEV